MLNKKKWKHLVAVIMCSALVISTPAVYAAEEQPIVQTGAKEENTQDTEVQKEVKEETTVDSNKEGEATGDTAETAEADVLPSVLTKNVTFEGKDFNISVSMGSGTKVAQSGEVKINGISLGILYDGKINFQEYLIAEKLSSGTYKIEVTFKDSNNQIINVDDSCTLVIPEAKRPEFTSVNIDYYGTEDIVLKFTNGTNYYELKNITELWFAIDGTTGEEGDHLFNSTKVGIDFTYDLAKGEIVIKKEFINQYKLVTLDAYYVGASGTLANGTKHVLGGTTGVNDPAWRVFCKDKVDANDFVIKDGVLEKYNGTASEVVIPDGVKSIGANAFYGNSKITRVTFPSSVTTIQESAFVNCINLQMTEIPSSVTYIGDSAFTSCHGIKELTIPRTVTTIGASAFAQSNIEKLTILGNNTTIGGSAFFSSLLAEVTLKGSFASIGDTAFGENEGIQKITIDGSVGSISGDPFYACLNLKNLTVTGDIASINEKILRQSKDVTIYCREGSNILKYAKENNLKYEIIAGTDTPKYEVTLPKENTSVPKSEMENLVNVNKTQDIVLKTPSGITFTFPKGSMKLIEGKESYDFGAELITDFSKVTNTPFNKDTFAFQINYNYSGELPGNASISIPVDSKWIGKPLYYYKILGVGDFKFLTSAVVDANGIYTITQSHCSDYVATTQAPDSKGNPTPTPTKTPSTVTPQTTSPKTGDNAMVWLYIVMILGAGTCVAYGVRRKLKVK